jgi:hypothetical protein
MLGSAPGGGIPLSGVLPWERLGADSGDADGFSLCSYAMSPRRKPTATAWALLRA